MEAFPAHLDAATEFRLLNNTLDDDDREAWDKLWKDLWVCVVEPFLMRKGSQRVLNDLMPYIPGPNSPTRDSAIGKWFRGWFERPLRANSAAMAARGVPHDARPFGYLRMARSSLRGHAWNQQAFRLRVAKHVASGVLNFRGCLSIAHHEESTGPDPLLVRHDLLLDQLLHVVSPEESGEHDTEDEEEVWGELKRLTADYLRATLNYEELSILCGLLGSEDDQCKMRRKIEARLRSVFQIENQGEGAAALRADRSRTGKRLVGLLLQAIRKRRA